MNLRFVLPALVQVIFLSRPLCAQLPSRLERCLPYPTLAQEISAMAEETKLSEPEPAPSQRVVIVSIRLVPEGHIPDSVRDRIIWSIKSPRYYDDPELSWRIEMQEAGILTALKDAGYFLATAKVAPRLIDSNPQRSRYALKVYLEAGRQYKLRDFRFKPADPDHDTLVFPASELRSHFHLNRGDPFNTSRIREGMKDLEKLYNSEGCIDMVAEPETLIDDDLGVIDVVMRIDEGEQYHVGKVELLGLDEKTQNQLRPQFKPGDIFDGNLIDELLRRNKSLLPSDASWRDVEITRHIKEGVIDLRFDFYTCPGLRERASSDVGPRN